MNSTIYTITAFHKDLGSTLKLLESLNKQNYKKQEIIAVNDGSSKEISRKIAKDFPGVKQLKGAGSLWWTGAIHLGVEKVLQEAKQGDYILTINNDCIVEPNYLSQILKTSQQNDRAIVGSLVFDKNNPDKVIDAGVKIDWEKGKFIPLKLDKNKETQESIDTLTTKGTLYPAEVFQDIGNFDKKHFPHYASDYEFACRAKKAGYDLILDYNSVVYNDPERTGFGKKYKKSDLKPKNLFNLLFSRKSKLNLKDQINFIRLCAPKKYRLKNYFLLFKKALSRLFVTLRL